MINIKPIVVDLPQENACIVPIFDVHIGAQEFQEKEFAEFLNAYKDKPNTYFIIGGDLVNNSIRSSIANPFDETMRPSDQKKYACELLKPIKDKILCAVGGNHEQRSRKETDDDVMYDICAKLDIEDKYREDIAFVLMRIKKQGHKGEVGNRNWCYTMAVTHGAGGGAYIGSSANRLERFGGIVEGLDILVTGHTHKPLTFPSAKLRIDIRNKTIAKEQFTVVQASSWLEWGGYTARRLLTPTARTTQEIWLNANEKLVKVVQEQ